MTNNKKGFTTHYVLDPMNEDARSRCGMTGSIGWYRRWQKRTHFTNNWEDVDCKLCLRSLPKGYVAKPLEPVVWL